MYAPIKTGEVILGAFGLGGQTSTGELIASRFKELPKKLGQFFKDPKKLLPVLGMVVLWLITYLLRAFGVDGIPAKILSFITFAGSSSFSNPLALLGGLVGKGIFAAAVTSLIGLHANKKTQAPRQKRSFGELFKGAFGVIKQDKAFRRFLTRGKKKNETQFFLLAFAFNINKLWNKTNSNRLQTHLFELDAA